MSELTIRRLLVDLDAPFERNWAGDAFTTAYFNALSMSFPRGEQFFMDSVRGAHAQLKPETDIATQARFDDEVKGFVGQEATHRRIHALFNTQLANQGLVNHWEARINDRMKLLEGANFRHALAITVANEHFTAMLAQHMLAHPAMLARAEPRLQTLWSWHAAEECEHRSVAFDLYAATGGSLKWRRRWMFTATFFLMTDALRQTVTNLSAENQLWRWSTWKSAGSFFFGKTGIVRHTFKPWLAFFKADFHPEHQDGQLSKDWLNDNATTYRAVGMPNTAV